MSGLLHRWPSFPLYENGTRDGARDPHAWDEVMRHDLNDSRPPSLILFGETGSGKTTAAHVKMLSWRNGGYFMRPIRATEIATLVRESAHDWRRHSRILRFLDGSEPEDEMINGFGGYSECINDVAGMRDFIGRHPEVEDDPIFRDWLTKDGLLIDDLSIPKLTEAYGKCLYEIIENRTAKRDNALILTSQVDAVGLFSKWRRDADGNPDLEDLARAIVRRIIDHCHPVHFIRQDHGAIQ